MDIILLHMTDLRLSIRSADVTEDEIEWAIGVGKEMIQYCEDLNSGKIAPKRYYAEGGGYLEEKRENNVGSVGLSAVQIGIMKNMFVAKLAGDVWKIFINPKCTGHSDVVVRGSEGCLSFPGEFGIVKRYQKFALSYVNEEGVASTKNFKKSKDPIIIQHEYDHCMGIRCIDKFERQGGEDGKSE